MAMNTIPVYIKNNTSYKVFMNFKIRYKPFLHNLQSMQYNELPIQLQKTQECLKDRSNRQLITHLKTLETDNNNLTNKERVKTGRNEVHKTLRKTYKY